MRLILSLFASFLFSTAQAETTVSVEGAEAEQIARDLELTSNLPVNLHLVGFFTERARPEVEYYDLTVSYRNRSRKPNITTEEKTALGELFQSKGLNPAVIAGGTTYLVYNLVVWCAASFCSVREGKLPGTN